MNNLIVNQRAKVKSSLVNSNNQLNELQPTFNRLHKEVSPGLSPGFHLKNNFPDYFPFHIANGKNPTSLHKHF